MQIDEKLVAKWESVFENQEKSQGTHVYDPRLNKPNKGPCVHAVTTPMRHIDFYVCIITSEEVLN